MKRSAITLFALLLVGSGAAWGQDPSDRSPNVHGVWGLDPGGGLFVFAHRFERYEGGDEISSIPTFTLAVGLPLGLTTGLEHTTYSEVIPGNLGGNETQFWLKRPFDFGSVGTAVLGGYNSAADSFDGAVDIRVPIARLRVYGEGRAFSDLFGAHEAGIAGAVGAALRLTEYIAVVGDVGRVLSEDGVPAAWSAGLNVEIPASPHYMSILVTNGGATTLQGASREKVLGEDGAVRYGFSFQVPIGGRGRWGRIFDPVTGE